MIWRRWKKKAKLKLFGHPITPFGPEWLDRFVNRALHLKGDFLIDYRLIDYPVSLMSTELNAALDGRLNNEERLKEDLSLMGVFHPSMSLYLLFKLRQFSSMGFSGFEGRHYSVFENIDKDMAEATNLQVLITALAYKYVLNGSVTHAHIPDRPSIESERRQIFFGTAIGIPTFFVRKNTQNHFMAEILKQTKKTRMSRRYPGYVRVHNNEYRKTLLQILKNDGRDLIDLFGIQSTLQDLKRRIQNPKEHSAAGKLCKGILEETGTASPMKLSGDEFNSSAEYYYRETLRKRHMVEACNILLEEYIDYEVVHSSDDGLSRKALKDILGGLDTREFLSRAFRNINEMNKNPDVLQRLIHLLLLTIYCDKEKAHSKMNGNCRNDFQDSSSVH
jgi:hypothetical protein